jgi:hypothetical protein
MFLLRNSKTQEKIQELRTKTKRLRAILFLYRDLIDPDEYQKIKKTLKDASKVISRYREEDVMFEHIQKMSNDNDLSIEERLTLIHELGITGKTNKKKLANAKKWIKWSRKKIEKIEKQFFDELGPSKYVERDEKDLSLLFQKTHKHLGQQDVKVLRKKVKQLYFEYQYYQNYLKISKSKKKELEKLSEILSEIHDLAILKSKLLQHPGNLENHLVDEINQKASKLRVLALAQLEKTVKLFE